MDARRIARVGEKADLLKAMGEYSKCIREIESVPEGERGYGLTLLLGWAYSNLAVLGDHDENDDTEDADQEMLSKAVDILMTIEERGRDDPVWNSRMCYALWMMDGREADALPYADRWMELDPKSDDARSQNRTIREFLEGTPAPEMYDKMQWDSVAEHIARHFGDFPNVYHELVSPDIHVDICLIPPRRDHDYHTLVTMGMGAHEMDVPEEAESTLRRAEVMINLPRDWKLDEASLQDSRWYWPIRMLKDVARLPVSTGCWLGWGHTVGMDEGERYDESTDMCGCILLNPGVFGEDSYICNLPDGDGVEFFQIVPLYAEEIQYKIENGAEALLDITNDDLLEIIDPQRLNAVTDFDRIDHDDAIMDDARRHQRIIDRLGLETDDLAAYSHMAIYLRWCIIRDMVNRAFASRHSELVDSVRSGEITDLRGFIRDDPDMDGKLTTIHLNRMGAWFAQWYNWGDRRNPYEFLRDVKDYADRVFGDREWKDEEKMFHAYLQIPWSEQYLDDMTKVIDGRYGEWLESHPQVSSDPADDDFPDPDGWVGARDCAISEAVLSGRSHMGFCVRWTPEKEDRGWDSGWRFFADDDDNLEEGRLMFRSLGFACDLFPEVRRILDLPYGTAFIRGEDGILHPYEEDDEGER